MTKKFQQLGQEKQKAKRQTEIDKDKLAKAVHLILHHMPQIERERGKKLRYAKTGIEVTEGKVK